MNYLDHLPAFNAMALGMLVLCLGGLAVGVVGTWRSRGRAATLWLANALAALLLVTYLFDR